MPAASVTALLLGLTLVAVVLAGVCYGVKEGVALLIGKTHTKTHTVTLETHTNRTTSYDKLRQAGAGNDWGAMD